MAHQVTFKFVPGDSVFLMYQNRVEKGKITHLQINQGDGEITIRYDIVFKESDGDNYRLAAQRIEKYLFKTKKSLLASL